MLFCLWILLKIFHDVRNQFAYQHAFVKLEPIYKIARELFLLFRFGESRHVTLALSPSCFIGLSKFPAFLFAAMSALQIREHRIQFKFIKSSRRSSKHLKDMLS